MGVTRKRPARRSPAWQRLLDALPDAAWIVDAATLRVLAANPPARTLLGLDAAALRRARADRLIATPEDDAFWTEVRAGEFALLDSHTFVLDAGGRALPVVRRIRRVRGVGGAAANAARYLVTVHDRSAAQREADAREELLADLAATLESIADGVLVTDLAGRIRSFNRRFARIWQLPEELLTERDDAAVWDWMRRNVADAEPYQRRLRAIEHEPLMQASDLLSLRSGQVLERVTQPQSRAGQPCGRVWLFRDRTALLTAGRRIEALETTDALTGLANRRRLFELLGSALAHARGCDQPLALLVIDLDRFKQVNDSLGDEVGDRILVETAERVRKGLRPGDQLARVGGDRFALLLTDADAGAAAAAARRALEAVSEPNAACALRLTLTASIGIGLFPGDGTDADTIMRHAETALERAKAGGRAGLRFCQPAHETDLRRRMAIDQAMRQALACQRLRLRYRPRVDLRSGAIIGAEASIRWRDPELGDVSPAEFVRVAEETGFIVPIGEWVLAQAVRQCARWRASGVAIPMSIEVSAAQFRYAAFVERIAQALAANAVPGAMLELELAESILAVDDDETPARLAQLVALGVRLAIDDFGAGSCGLGGLRRHRVERLKIDRSIVAGVPGDPRDAAVVRAIVELARGFGIGIVADGVRTEAQREFVRAAGCDAYQGDLVAPALDPLSLAERWCALRRAPEAAIAATSI